MQYNCLKFDICECNRFCYLKVLKCPEFPMFLRDLESGEADVTGG